MSATVTSFFDIRGPDQYYKNHGRGQRSRSNTISIVCRLYTYVVENNEVTDITMRHHFLGNFPTSPLKLFDCHVDYAHERYVSHSIAY